jgi:hypothetical protein
MGTLLALSAPHAEGEPKHVDVKNLSCESFLAQPDDMRPLLVAWCHGYTHAGGDNWILDPPAARAFVSSVEDLCKKSPKGSFRYQVLEAAKTRQAEAKKAAKAAK